MKKQKGEGTLLASVIMSAPGALVTGLAALQSTSGTQLADFLRRTVELVALVVSYSVFRKIQRKADVTPDEKAGLERFANACVGFAMALTGFVMFVLAMLRIKSYTPSGSVISGLAIALLGVATNGYLCFRYQRLSRTEDSALLSAQFKLYRAKTVVDACVSAALLTVALAPDHPATRYVDIVGTVFVAVYLLYNGFALVRQSLRR